MSKPNPHLQSLLDVCDAIARERDYQLANRNFQHDIGAWLTVLRVELAEAEQAWAKRHPDKAPALREVLQVAAVAVACLQQHGVYER